MSWLDISPSPSPTNSPDIGCAWWAAIARRPRARLFPLRLLGRLVAPERICRTVSIMARIASGRVRDASWFAVHPSRAASWEGCRRDSYKGRP